MTTARRTGGRAGEDVSELDKRIIEHLQQDGRRPFTQIAADLGVSEAAVRARSWGWTKSIHPAPCASSGAAPENSYPRRLKYGW